MQNSGAQNSGFKTAVGKTAVNAEQQYAKQRSMQNSGQCKTVINKTAAVKLRSSVSLHAICVYEQ